MAFCRDCGREFERGELSRRGLCLECGAKRIEESILQMTEQRGPIYDRYKARQEAGMALRSKRRE